MIKIIDGKRYDTDTATEVYHHSYGIYGDFNYRARTLYRTARGAWFIHHVGGALTDMAVSVGNNSMGGSVDIEPVNDDEAYAFLEKHSDDSDALAAIEKYFADNVEEA